MNSQRFQTARALERRGRVTIDSDGQIVAVSDGE